MRKMWAVTAAAAIALAACSGDTDGNGSGEAEEMSQGATLGIVQERGNLMAGVKDSQAGFGFVDEAGNFTGLEVDIAKGIAAAIFGDATKVEFRGVSASDRFAILAAGEIDVLIRTTTWTLSRDTELATNFVATTFYDGQGIMVRNNSGVNALTDLQGATVCVTSGTTTEANLADQMSSRSIDYTPVVIDDQSVVFDTYEAGRCDAVTADASALAANRTQFANPGDHKLLDITLSKEPLGPSVRHGDDQWLDIVQWVVYALFAAEELGITSANVAATARTTEDPVVRRLLGAEGDLGDKLGLRADWAVQVIRAIGNYAELYDRHLGCVAAAGLVGIEHHALVVDDHRRVVDGTRGHLVG